MCKEVDGREMPNWIAPRTNLKGAKNMYFLRVEEWQHFLTFYIILVMNRRLFFPYQKEESWVSMFDVLVMDNLVKNSTDKTLGNPICTVYNVSLPNEVSHRRNLKWWKIEVIQTEVFSMWNFQLNLFCFRSSTYSSRIFWKIWWWKTCRGCLQNP